MLAYVLCQVNGNKTAKMEDFLPKRLDEAEAAEPEDTFGAVAALLKGVAAKNNTGAREGRRARRNRIRSSS